MTDIHTDVKLINEIFNSETARCYNKSFYLQPDSFSLCYM